MGDVILWFQLLDHAKRSKQPIVLVTDDAKEDWWQSQDGKTIGPRPELVQEMREKACVQFYAYTSERWLQEAAAFLDLKPDETAIQEAREVRELVSSGTFSRRLTVSSQFTAQQAGQSFSSNVVYREPLLLTPTSITLQVEEEANVEPGSIAIYNISNEGFTLAWRATTPGDGRLNAAMMLHGVEA